MKLGFRDWIYLLRDAYIYGLAIGTVFTFAITIGLAAQYDWLIIMDFNQYGEGALEYALMLIWFPLFFWAIIEKIRGLTNDYRGNKKGNTQISNTYKDARDEYYNL